MLATKLGAVACLGLVFAVAGGMALGDPPTPAETTLEDFFRGGTQWGDPYTVMSNS